MNAINHTQALEIQLSLSRLYARVADAQLRQYPADVARILMRAKPVSVVPEILTGLVDALSTLPNAIPLRETDLPFPDGFAYFNGATWHAGLDLFVYGFAWSATAEGVTIGALTAGKETDKVELNHWTAIEWGNSLDSTVDIDSVLDPIASDTIDVVVEPDRTVSITKQDAHRIAADLNYSIRSLAYSLWHFMAQRVAVRGQWRADRATRRRLGRDRELPLIETVALRARDYDPADSPSERLSGGYGVRFVVRGHWHQYWCGSGAERHLEPRWLEPYIKGPEDMPLATPAKLFAVVR